MPELWDPLTYENLMAGTVAHFQTQPLRSLDDRDDVQGPGIYALYYTGKIPEYEPIANTEVPIYVGKAVAAGARKGGVEDIAKPALQLRLRDHAKSITQSDNLSLGDFLFRALPIMPVWIVFAERALITRYKPVWNRCLEGFGKHDQGRNRRNTARSWWDTLHQGRPWAKIQSGQDSRGNRETTHWRKPNNWCRTISQAKSDSRTLKGADLPYRQVCAEH